MNFPKSDTIDNDALASNQYHKSYVISWYKW